MKITSPRRLTAIAAALVATAVLTPNPSTAAQPPAPPSQDAGSGLRATLQQDADALLRQGAPGALVELQTATGELKVRSGYGNTDTRNPVPWNARFRIASMTKPFVAATVLQLVGEGRLSLDDTVDRWLPGLVRGHGNDGRQVTVRQVLQHTSGLPEYLQEMTYLFSRKAFEKRRFDTLTPRRAVRFAMRHRPDFAPGTSWNYSNTNYVLAGLIVESVTGRSWQREVERRIVRPLGLDGTTLPRTRAGVPSPHAVGYERFPGRDATPQDPDYGPAIDATRLNPSIGGAAGEIISTTDDTNRFLRALVRGELLRPAELAEMQRTVPTNEDFRQYLSGARYGLGLMRIRSSCGGYWSHGGDIMGFMTRNGVTDDGSRSVVVTLNTDSLQRDPGVPAPTEDVTNSLIDHALCGAADGR
jgi:D-alanyl-D-alanine carboxypeptidase